jgi:hypothetical protein
MGASHLVRSVCPLGLQLARPRHEEAASPLPIAGEADDHESKSDKLAKPTGDGEDDRDRAHAGRALRPERTAGLQE